MEVQLFSMNVEIIVYDLHKQFMQQIDNNFE